MNAERISWKISGFMQLEVPGKQFEWIPVKPFDVHFNFELICQIRVQATSIFVWFCLACQFWSQFGRILAYFSILKPPHQVLFYSPSWKPIYSTFDPSPSSSTKFASKTSEPHAAFGFWGIWIIILAKNTQILDAHLNFWLPSLILESFHVRKVKIPSVAFSSASHPKESSPRFRTLITSARVTRGRARPAPMQSNVPK